MRVLYISYWSLNDPLTISSVMPTLPALRKHLGSTRVTLVTIERGSSPYPPYTIPLDFVEHVPISPPALGNALFAKAWELLLMPRWIESLCRARGIDMIFARCSVAGAIAYKVHRRTSIPFVVESFEPHSDYMVNCGAWARDSLRYRYARKFERLQMREARLLITVTRNYRNHLIAKEGVDTTRIAVIPCVTDLERTSFDSRQRELVRGELGLGSGITGIYAGKFGDLYYDDEAFQIIRDAFHYFEGFRMVLLTPTPLEHIARQLKNHGVPEDRVHARLVRREEVPAYLSAADFAYSFHRPSDTSGFFSPIKHAEYWACGLPFIAPDGIGDDFGIIASEGGGANLNRGLTNVRECHEAIARIVARPDYRASIRQLAIRYKGAGLIDEVFSVIFKPRVDVR